MTFGGVHTESLVEVPVGTGWLASERLWSLLLGPTFEPNPGAAPIRFAATGLRQAADRQLIVSKTLAPAMTEAVACAWAAVGVLDEAATLGAIKKKCARAAVGCMGKADGVYCDPVNRFAAYRCRGGQHDASPAACGVISSPWEPPVSTLCVTEDGIPGHRAKLRPDGSLTCVGPLEVDR